LVLNDHEETFLEPNEMSSPEGAASDEQPFIAPTTVEGITMTLGINGQPPTLDTQSKRCQVQF